MLREIGKKAFDWSCKNAPTILTAVGVAGVVVTAVATGKATIKAKKVLDEMPEDADIKEKAKVVAPIMAKPFLIGAATIFCILASDRIHVKRNAAIAACYTLSSKALEEYEEKVVETIGEGKNKKIKDAIAENTINEVPPSEELMIEGDGKILCFDKWSGRYFRAKAEDIDKALNYINYVINTEGYVCLNEWYDQLGLTGTENGDRVGWYRDEDGLVGYEPSWSQTSILYKDTYPVRVITFSIKPKEYFEAYD